MITHVSNQNFNTTLPINLDQNILELIAQIDDTSGQLFEYSDLRARIDRASIRQLTSYASTLKTVSNEKLNNLKKLKISANKQMLFTAFVISALAVGVIYIHIFVYKFLISLPLFPKSERSFVYAPSLLPSLVYAITFLGLLNRAARSVANLNGTKNCRTSSAREALNNRLQNLEKNSAIFKRVISDAINRLESQPNNSSDQSAPCSERQGLKSHPLEDFDCDVGTSSDPNCSDNSLNIGQLKAHPLEISECDLTDEPMLSLSN